MISKNLIYLIAFIALTSCKTWNASMLVPKNDPINPKLLTLDRRIEDLSNTNVVANTDEIRLFTDEVENNLIDPYGDKYGYIAIKRNIIEAKSGGLGYTIAGGIPAGIPWLFGLPMSNIKYKIEIELRILDKNNKLIGKYSATGESKVTVALYHGYSAANAYRKSYLEAMLEAFDKIRPKIQKDSKRVNDILLTTGKL
jgi:hypothetical protein